MMKEDANQKLKLARDIETKSQLKSRDRLQAKHDHTSHRIDTITKLYKTSLQKHSDDARTVQSNLQARNKINLAEMQAKYESKIKDLIGILDDKAEEVFKLKHSAKEERESMMEEKLELKQSHWKEKLKLWNEKKELRTAVVAKTQEKRDAIVSLKRSHSEIVSELETERSISSETAKAATKAATAKDKLAKDRLAKLKLSTTTANELQDELRSECARCIELEEELSKAMKWRPRIIQKYWVPNSAGRCGAEAWEEWIVQIVLELLSHWTPPSCIPANILTIAESLNPNVDVVRELPGLSFVRECCSVLVVVTKTIAAYLLGRVTSYKQLFSDSTSRRQTAIQNVVLSLLSESGYEMVTLSSGIIARDKTSQSLVNAIRKSFSKGQNLLLGWRNKTADMFPNKPNLLDMIPQSTELTLAKLGKGGCVSTDNCNAARKFHTLLIGLIKETCVEQGYSPEEIKLFEGDC